MIARLPCNEKKGLGELKYLFTEPTKGQYHLFMCVCVWSTIWMDSQLTDKTSKLPHFGHEHGLRSKILTAQHNYFEHGYLFMKFPNLSLLISMLFYGNEQYSFGELFKQ